MDSEPSPLIWTQDDFQFETEPYAYHRVALEPLPHARVLHENTDLLRALPALAKASTEYRHALYRGERCVEGVDAALATVYAGHQFGYFNPQLGDGRAALIGGESAIDVCEFFPHPFQHLVMDFISRYLEQGRQDLAFHHFDLFQKKTNVEYQLKGSGQTPYSRMGDGKAVLRSSVREYLASEALFRLGIPSTRALALVHDPDTPVWREFCESAAMVLRVAPSFLRFGHLEYWGRQGQTARLRPYIETCFQAFFTESVTPVSLAQKTQAVLSITAILNAVTVAQWQAVGFCHGVMNSDNSSLWGLTLDYGPYGFLDTFDMGHICNHSDEQGRYRYQNQPAVALWNLKRLVEACSALVGEAEIQPLQEQIEALFQDAFNTSFLTLYRQKLGLEDRRLVPDIELGNVLKSLFSFLHQNQIDYTRFFYALPQWAEAYTQQNHSQMTTIETQVMKLPSTLNAHWLRDIYAPCLQRGPQPRQDVKPFQTPPNPSMVLRNYIAQDFIEEAEAFHLDALAEGFKRLQDPFSTEHETDPWFQPPPQSARSIAVSCSS
jgi:uncharacterized protein YdiU (UPF0061 family)